MVCAQWTVEVDVPLHQAYDAWADLSRHAGVLAGVQAVEPLDGNTWRMHGRNLAGQPSWTVRLAERVEDEHVTLHTLDGPWDAMVVLFERIGPERTAITLLRDHEPENGPEPDLLAVVREDLARFKRSVEGSPVPKALPPLVH